MKAAGVSSPLSYRDLQKQILALQKQILFLTKQLATQSRKKVKVQPKPKVGRAPPVIPAVPEQLPEIKKWCSCKRFVVSRKNATPSRALGYAVVDGVFYLKLCKGQVVRLSKVTRLGFKGVHLTSKKSMRLVLTGKKPLILKQTKKVNGSRSGGKCNDQRKNLQGSSTKPSGMALIHKSTFFTESVVDGDPVLDLAESLPDDGLHAHRLLRNGVCYYAVTKDKKYGEIFRFEDVSLAPRLMRLIISSVSDLPWEGRGAICDQKNLRLVTKE